ncbi:MFS transporter [Vibrio coralliilyticus]|uniref:MFS transporter n=1 Tax=Vibrio coralliilyticus TaxID=190893 RepID=UPI0015CCDE6D|nr:MFS transporter [Vibrio coralliilyticus]MCC2520601.1 MFS transporter [Vibrio coralliilyticus]
MNILAIILVGCLTQFSSLGVIATAISKLELVDSSGAFSSSVSIANTLGISFTGVLLGGLLARYQGFRIGFFAPLFSSLLIPPLIFTSNIYVILVIIFSISIIIGLDNPNNNSSLNKLIKDKKDKAHTFTKYTTAMQSSVIISPLLSAAIVVYFGHDMSFMFFMFFYALTCLPWIASKELRKLSSSVNTHDRGSWEGYKIIMDSPALRGLTISRILNNLLFTGLIVLIPMMVAKASTTNEQFTFIQNIVLSLISASFVINGLVSNNILKNQPTLAATFAKMSTLFAALAIAVSASFGFSEYSLYLMALMIGWGQFYFRISGMTLGQAVTPQEHLGEVILASDTLVRGITAGYSVCLLFLVNVYDSFVPLFVFCIIGSAAPIFLSQSSKIYKDGIESEV